MSKRQISKQQSVRIKKNQKDHQTTLHTGENGLVVTRFSKHASIEDQHGNQLICSIRPNIDSLIAGDRVVWQRENLNQGVVVSRYPRDTMLGRPNKQNIIKPVAANITQVMITIAPKPDISWSLLDSYLVMAEHLNLLAVIVLNKVDLINDDLKEKLITLYQPLGYSVLLISCQQNEGLHALQQTLDQQISVFVGQSGVGKSSIIQSLLPETHDIQTQHISERSELGKHTTSNSYYYHLPTGGALIDSPGVREFGLWHMPAQAIAAGYREFRPYLSQCKFRNCNHRTDIGCALLEAVNKGLITQQRYDSYVTMATQLAK